MTRTALVRVIVAMVIAAVLGAASLIVARDTTGPVGDTPSGFFH